MKERDAERALRNLGFAPEPTGGGSHRQGRLTCNGRLYKVTLAPHHGEVKANDVRSMIQQAGVSKREWYRAAAALHPVGERFAGRE